MILFGFQHCGKSTFGRKLANHMQLPFLDTDELIAQRVGDISRLFRENPQRFREIEKEVVQELPTNHVIALGGGTILDDQSRCHLETLAPLIYLHISKERLKKRYKDPEIFEQLYAKRLPLYRAIEAATIDLEESSWQAIL
ncbi:MAG: Shikimate kinase [Chlamydiales bacterium]|nr:Shikimate kinase [Chlamydiales bacterium]MCH9635263.1 Shikimate kinase [Chlamydiales bacterium]